MKTIQAIKSDVQQLIIMARFMLFQREIQKSKKTYISAIYTHMGAIRLNSHGQRLVA